MTYRVIQWATGGLASKAVAGIVGHRDLELVGAWVHSEDKEGRDVGEICGLAPIGVAGTRDKDALLATDADVVCYMAGRTWRFDPMATVHELARILRSGKNVVNATWPSLVHPKGVSQEAHDILQAACIEGGTTLFTSGIDPGQGSTGLALTALSMTSEVRSVRTFEIMNYANWNYPEMITWFGFGQPDKEKCALLHPGVTANIFKSSIELLAGALGVVIEELVEDHEVLYADEAFEVASVPIPVGTISGARFEVKGMVNGEPTIIVEHVTRLRDQDFADKGMPAGGYKAIVVGEPHISLDLNLSSDFGDITHAGYVACAMAVVNAIPQVVQAAPGVLTMLDLLPYVTGNVRPGGRPAP
jgi:4-hydroxy-tetrahydrodipicolinate reductase